jgi:hypothetical protein
MVLDLLDDAGEAARGDRNAKTGSEDHVADLVAMRSDPSCRLGVSRLGEPRRRSRLGLVSLGNTTTAISAGDGRRVTS